jgi:ABC-2 type transport system permease protein
VRQLFAGVRYELAVIRRSPGELSWLFIAPLYALILLAIVEHAGRPDLVPYAVLGPASMALLGMALLTAGELIQRDRDDGLLELEIGAPASFPVVLVGRIGAVVAVGLPAVAEAWLVAGLVFGRWVRIEHPAVFAVTLLLTVSATAASATAMAALFVLARSARIFQNSLSFPLFVLGGAVVPVALLPDWVRPVSRIVYLSWATDLLRASARPESVSHLWLRLGALALLGAVTALLGVAMVKRVVDRVRRLGTASYA